MFNTNIFYGTDGILTVSDPDGLDPESLGKYLSDTGVVGRVTNVSLQISTDVRPFHELGSHMPKELRTGNVHISGSVERAYLNGALLKLMLGQYAENEESSPPFKMPSFNMKITLDNLKPEGDQGNSILAIYGVIFDSWQFNLPEDDFVLEKLTFKAKRLSVQDFEISA